MLKKLIAALLVIVNDQRIKTWLEDNDPQAFRQVNEALSSSTLAQVIHEIIARDKDYAREMRDDEDDDTRTSEYLVGLANGAAIATGDDLRTIWGEMQSIAFLIVASGDETYRHAMETAKTELKMLKKCRRGVEIVERKTKNVVKFIDCGDRSQQSIDRIEEGCNINLNHEEFFTQLVGVEEDC